MYFNLLLPLLPLLFKRYMAAKYLYVGIAWTDCLVRDTANVLDGNFPKQTNA